MLTKNEFNDRMLVIKKPLNLFKIKKGKGGQHQWTVSNIQQFNM